MSGGEHGARASVPRPVLLVTGGSRGIGAATARLAATRGYAVCVNYLRSREAADAVARAIGDAGGTAIAVAADISREADVLRLFATIDETLGPITALVNNAGILERQARVDSMTAERLHRVPATNVVGYFLCAREAVRRMSTRHGGRGGAIVNVSSAASRLGSAGEYVDYAASKGATDTMTIGLVQEVAAVGIRWRSHGRSSGSCRTRHPTRPAPSSTSREGDSDATRSRGRRAGAIWWDGVGLKRAPNGLHRRLRLLVGDARHGAR
jgi:NAD(P)-dependent dehydrogenase (short-subunit alcohol dehydrogenase family)